MQSLWNDGEAAGYQGDLAQRVYSSRLLGRDKSLVQHGGGNTSVRLRERNLVGDEEEILYVKGSGQDLEFIEETGFAPVRLAHVLRLAQLKTLRDPQLVNELQTHLTRAASPAPSVETILHALLPHKYRSHPFRCRARSDQHRRWRPAHRRNLRRPAKDSYVMPDSISRGCARSCSAARRKIPSAWCC